MDTYFLEQYSSEDHCSHQSILKSNTLLEIRQADFNFFFSFFSPWPGCTKVYAERAYKKVP